MIAVLEVLFVVSTFSSLKLPTEVDQLINVIFLSIKTDNEAIKKFSFNTS